MYLEHITLDDSVTTIISQPRKMTSLTMMNFGMKMLMKLQPKVDMMKFIILLKPRADMTKCLVTMKIMKKSRVFAPFFHKIPNFQMTIHVPSLIHILHTVSSQNFRSFRFLSSFLVKNCFFLKSQHSILHFCHLAQIFYSMVLIFFL